MNGTNARACEHRVSGFRDHRHIYCYAVALADTLGFEHIGEAAHFFIELAIGDLGILVWFVAFPDDRDIIAMCIQMPVNAIYAGIERAVFVPFNRHVFFTVMRVLDFGIRLHPVNAFAMRAPETVRVAEAVCIHFVIFGLVDKRFRFNGLGYFKYQIVRHNCPLVLAS